VSDPELRDAEEALRAAIDNFVRMCEELGDTGRAAEASALIARLEMLFALDIARSP
jgi:hypothetical protein